MGFLEFVAAFLPVPEERLNTPVLLIERQRLLGGQSVAEDNPERVEEIKGRFSYRMHDLGEFMKGLMQRFTQWFNWRHKWKGTLWEDRFKSVIEGSI